MLCLFNHWHVGRTTVQCQLMGSAGCGGWVLRNVVTARRQGAAEPCLWMRQLVRQAFWREVPRKVRPFSSSLITHESLRSPLPSFNCILLFLLERNGVCLEISWTTCECISPLVFTANFGELQNYKDLLGMGACTGSWIWEARPLTNAEPFLLWNCTSQGKCKKPGFGDVSYLCFNFPRNWKST